MGCASSRVTPKAPHVETVKGLAALFHLDRSLFIYSVCRISSIPFHSISLISVTRICSSWKFNLYWTSVPQSWLLSPERKGILYLSVRPSHQILSPHISTCNLKPYSLVSHSSKGLYKRKNYGRNPLQKSKCRDFYKGLVSLHLTSTIASLHWDLLLYVSHLMMNPLKSKHDLLYYPLQNQCFW